MSEVTQQGGCRIGNSSRAWGRSPSSPAMVGMCGLQLAADERGSTVTPKMFSPGDQGPRPLWACRPRGAQGWVKPSLLCRRPPPHPCARARRQPPWPTPQGPTWMEGRARRSPPALEMAEQAAHRRAGGRRRARSHGKQVFLAQCLPVLRSHRAGSGRPRLSGQSAVGVRGVRGRQVNQHEMLPRKTTAAPRRAWSGGGGHVPGNGRPGSPTPRWPCTVTQKDRL